MAAGYTAADRRAIPTKVLRRAPSSMQAQPWNSLLKESPWRSDGLGTDSRRSWRERQVRSRLRAGGRRIRTLGSPWRI